jgi:hypothetical protein
MNNRRFSAEQVQQLAAQLEAYRIGAPPFNKPAGGAGFDCRAWFTTLPSVSAGMITNLATLLLDIVPHAADTERTISIHRWFDAPRRNRATVQTHSMMATIKLDIAAARPDPPPRREKVSGTKRRASGAAATDLTGDDAEGSGSAAAPAGSAGGGGDLEPFGITEPLDETEDNICTAEDLQDLLGALGASYEEDLQADNEVPNNLEARATLSRDEIVQAFDAAWKGVEVSNNLWDPKTVVAAEPVVEVGALGTAAPGAAVDIGSILEETCGL